MRRLAAATAIAMLIAAGAAANDRKPQPWFGMGIRPQRNQTTGERYLLVERTVPRGPADRAGIRAGDIVTRIGGVPLQFTDTLDMLLYLSDRKPGERMKFTIVRNGAATEVVLVVGVMPESGKAGWARALEVARQERIAAHRAGQ